MIIERICVPTHAEALEKSLSPSLCGCLLQAGGMLWLNPYDSKWLILLDKGQGKSLVK